MLIEAGILRPKEIPLEVLRQPKTTKSEEIIRLTITIPTIQTFFL